METLCSTTNDLPNWLRAWMISNFIMGYDISGAEKKEEKWN